MEYILIGEIVNTFGIKGELKVKSYTDFNEVRFSKDQTLYIKFHNAYQEVCVHSYREHKGHVLVAFKDLLDINKVEKYIGCEIYVSEDDLHELDEGEYYFRDLVGCKVQLHGEIIGEVTEVMDYPANEVLRIQMKDKEILLPFVEAFVLDVDLDEELITIDVIEGMLWE